MREVCIRSVHPSRRAILTRAVEFLRIAPTRLNHVIWTRWSWRDDLALTAQNEARRPQMKTLILLSTQPDITKKTRILFFGYYGSRQRIEESKIQLYNKNWNCLDLMRVTPVLYSTREPSRTAAAATMAGTMAGRREATPFLLSDEPLLLSLLLLPLLPLLPLVELAAAAAPPPFDEPELPEAEDDEEVGIIDWMPLAIVDTVWQFDELGVDMAVVGVVCVDTPFV